MSDQLDALFDDPSTRSLPLTARNLVTDHLETTLKRIIDLVQPDLFVEIGAFEAAFSIQMRKRFPASPVNSSLARACPALFRTPGLLEVQE